MKKVFIILISVSFFLFSCFNSKCFSFLKSNTINYKNKKNKDENVDYNAIIKSIREELKNKKIDNPRYVLLKLLLLEIDGKYNEMKEYVYGINYLDLFNTSEKIIYGIKNKIVTGNFSYSRKGILFHANYVNRLAKEGDMSLISKYILSNGIEKYDLYLKETINREPKNIIMYELDMTVLGFIRIKDKLKLFYTKDLSDSDINLEHFDIKE